MAQPAQSIASILAGLQSLPGASRTPGKAGEPIGLGGLPILRLDSAAEGAARGRNCSLIG